jgi:hypothetical protein
MDTPKLQLCPTPEKVREHRRTYRSKHGEELNKYRREHYIGNKEQYLKNATTRRKYKISWWSEFKKGLKCSRCKESHSVCLEFHHIDPTTKEHNISMMYRSHSEKRILEEIAKCIVLCANCHRKEHARWGQ